MTKQEPDREKLMRRMKITKSNRFNCSKRLENQVQNQSLASSMLAIFTIVAGLFVIGHPASVEEGFASFIGVTIAGFSIVSLLLNLHRPPSVTVKRAADAHRCAREISHVYRRLEASQINLAAASSEYEGVVSQYPDNHDDCDYMLTVYKYRSEMGDQSKDANFFSAVVKTRLSEWSPFFLTAFGLLVVLSVWLLIPALSSLVENQTPQMSEEQLSTDR